MHITQWGEYGIHCAVFLADRAKAGATVVSASEIAESQGIALDYAQQILQRLRKSSIVESVRGPQGGYRLAKPAKDITLKEVLIAAEGDTFDVICDVKPLTQERCGPGTSCNLRPVWIGLKDVVNNYLTKFTLEEMLVANVRSAIQDETPIQITRHAVS